MDIVFCFDINFINYCYVPATNAIRQSKHESIVFHLIVSEQCKGKSIFTDLIDKITTNKSSVNCYYVNSKVLYSLPISLHASLANYYRLLIPVLLPNNITKVIYLDVDILILNSLELLWNIDLEHFPIGAVSEQSQFEEEALRLNVPYQNGTFNSGVLIINLEEIRSKGYFDECLNYIEKNRDSIKYWDQDALNVIFSNNWKKITSDWNVQCSYFTNKIVKFKYGNLKPNIIHFTGDTYKPWNFILNRYSKMYLKTLKEGGYKIDTIAQQPLTSKSLKKIIKKLSRFIFEKIKIIIHIVLNLILYLKLYLKLFFKYRHKLNYGLKVLNGFFAGLILSRNQNFFIHKILGLYESDVHKILKKIIKNRNKTFIFIGFNDFFLPFGMAFKSPSTSILIFNNSRISNLNKLEMVRGNKLANNFILEKYVNNSIIFKHINSLDQGVIFFDVREFEVIFFSVENVDLLKLLYKFSFLIKSYESNNLGTNNHLINYFKKTHYLEYMTGKDNILNATNCNQNISKNVFNFKVYTSVLLQIKRSQEKSNWLYFVPHKDNQQ